jgi:exosortase/archaeosortase
MTVVLAVVAANALWALAIADQIVIPKLASAAVLFVRLKWLACPLAAYLLWSRSHTVALLALLWPLVLLLLIPIATLPLTLLPFHMPVRVGVIEAEFAHSLGYQEQA